MQLYHCWDTFEFDQGAHDQELTNHSACFVERKFTELVYNNMNYQCQGTSYQSKWNAEIENTDMRIKLK